MQRIQPAALLQVMHPITWFAPMWAFACGIVSTGESVLSHGLVLVGGIVLAGPLVCGTSQVVNDWFDRHVDAINEPDRPIPSGRIPGRWGLYIALIMTVASLVLAWVLGIWVFWAAVVGLALAWAYSMPPFRLKLNGWWGNGAVGLSYETLPWFTAAALMTGDLPSLPIIALALLYGIGAHGIMTLNDFKAIEGDSQMGVRTLPVQLGAPRAARLACWVMAVPQAGAALLLLAWGFPWHALIVAGLLVAQLGLMARFLRDPRQYAPWYNATGTTLSVLGMMVGASALGYGA
ncbi:chlorophyll synthase ChlG [Roseospira visakhapatnamensis]|uniref:Chlorophyll synthase n=1 Tax=Roseospira visakhapatnamensis TaxID=390880 RepID=A0A7W6REZ8_9PROT|nr:chlorophyll synthase ChlG [Roseospira visakhapatnamensis]MBB4267202.1 chlorophyll synthase [Roseospira visakhapatnamensis]